MKRPCVFCVCLLSVLAMVAQQPASSTQSASKASVKFSFDWLRGDPWQKYTIAVQSDGNAQFDGTPHPEENNDTEPYQQSFTISEANRQKIFELAEKLNYFRGDFDSHLKHVANTGSKTLEYQSAEIKGSTTYNWSKDQNIEELTHMFQGIAMTIDYGRKLAFQYRFDKLGIDQRMKELEDLQANHEVEELHIISPMLQKIAADPNIMNISRQSAQRLLQSINQPAPAALPAP